MKKHIIHIVFLLAGLQALYAQEILIQWTGVVRDELSQPIPYAHIISQKDWRGTASNAQGRFTIITYPSDTLLVSFLGYKPVKIPVPNFTQGDSRHYIMDIIMEEDPIMLSELVILPWRTYGEFREAFKALELPEDDLQRAYRNIAVLQQQIHSAIYSRRQSPNANFRDVMNTRTNRMMTYGHMYPTYQITNPFAWARFFQALQNGEFRQQDDSSSDRSVIQETIQEYYDR